MRRTLSLALATLVFVACLASSADAARKRSGSNGTPSWVDQFWRDQASKGR